MDLVGGLAGEDFEALLTESVGGAGSDGFECAETPPDVEGALPLLGCKADVVLGEDGPGTIEASNVGAEFGELELDDVEAVRIDEGGDPLGDRWLAETPRIGRLQTPRVVDRIVPIGEAVKEHALAERLVGSAVAGIVGSSAEYQQRDIARRRHPAEKIENAHGAAVDDRVDREWRDHENPRALWGGFLLAGGCRSSAPEPRRETVLVGPEF